MNLLKLIEHIRELVIERQNLKYLIQEANACEGQILLIRKRDALDARIADLKVVLAVFTPDGSE